MTTASHLAAGYLIAQSTRLLGHSPTTSEVQMIMASGVFVDLDYLVGHAIGKRGESHHNFITHTPLGTFVTWVLLALFLKPYLSAISMLFALIAMITHLILDDASYWFQKLGFQEFTKTPQINWGYPFTKFSPKDPKEKTFYEFVFKQKANTITEIVLISSALLLFLT